MLKPFNKQKNTKKCHGQSIVELIIAIAIFSLISAAITTMVVGSFTGLTRGGEQTQAEALAREGIEAVRSIKDRAWNENVYSTSSVSVNSNQWNFDGEGSTETIGKFTRVISFEDVCRDVSNNIVDCPGDYLDVQSKKVTVVVSWEVREGVLNTVRHSSYVTNWDSKEWIQTDWSGGAGQSVWSDTTKFDNDDDNLDFTTNGEIKLKISNISCSPKIWNFSNGFDYVYDTEKIEVVTEVAQLKSSGGEPIDGFTQGLWHLDEVSGSIIDYSGIGNDLVNVKGSPLYGQSGKFATSLDFNGNSSRYITNTQQTGLNITGPITIDAWVYRTSEATAGEAIVSKWRESGNRRSYSFNVNNTNHLEFWVSSNGSNLFHVEAANTVPLNSWVHVAGVYDGSNLYVFQNGNLENSLVYSSGIANKTPSFFLSGAQGFSGVGFFNGKIDEVRISNTARWITNFTPPASSFGPVSYPADDPPINPNSTHSVSGVGSWSGFTETATKNGGEIYYQLSDDGGTTWKYWDGGAWGEATASDYNTATIINANITSFPVDTEQIMFKAFLSSDGSQQVILDKVEIDCEKQKDWDFASASDYSYDSGKIIVAGGTASLADLSVGGSCSGVPTSCNIFNTLLSCQDQGGCAWGAGLTDSTINPDFSSTLDPWTTGIWGTKNATLSRSISGGNPGGYAKIQFPNTKKKLSGGYFEQSFTTTGAAEEASLDLDWIVSQYTGAADSLTLYAFVDSTPGTPTIGQEVWSSGNQTVTNSWTNVSDIDVSGKITGAGTYYLKIAAYVDYTNSGANRSYAIGFDNVTLSWTTTDSCSGIPTSCNIFATQPSCLLQDGCSWTGASVYPTDNPSINPIEVYSGTDINSWSGFTETATKNGGEIYYQLSDDGGTTWKYWDGGAWGEATDSDYNTATIINTNISSFPVDTEQIMFKAFLSSDGSQQVILDNVKISWAENISGYATVGTFISSSFNMNNSSPVQTIEWDENIPTEVEAIKFEVSTAPDNSGSPGVWTDWYGASGVGSFFTYGEGNLISTNLNNNQWVRYRATLIGDGTNTPILEEIRINYK